MEEGKPQEIISQIEGQATPLETETKALVIEVKAQEKAKEASWWSQEFKKPALWVSCLAFGVSLYSAYTSTRQLDNARDDRRAWLTVPGINFEPLVVGKAPETTLRIKNSGKTPAIRVECAAIQYLVGSSR